MDKKTILIVDDSRCASDYLKSIFRFADMNILSAVNGWEALGAIRSVEPDIVLLDVMLPKENGYLVSAMVKDDIRKGVYSKYIPVILLTGRDLSSDPEREATVLEISQADCMMYKPVDKTKLLEKVHKLLSASPSSYL